MSRIFALIILSNNLCTYVTVWIKILRFLCVVLLLQQFFFEQRKSVKLCMKQKVHTIITVVCSSLSQKDSHFGPGTLRIQYPEQNSDCFIQCYTHISHAHVFRGLEHRRRNRQKQKGQNHDLTKQEMTTSKMCFVICFIYSKYGFV